MRKFQSLTLKAIAVFAILLSSTTGNSQFLKKLKEGVKDLKSAATGAKQTVREISGATKEVTSTVNSFKRTWTKDTSSNIKYEQIPDYRSRQEVEINQKQNLEIENGEFKNFRWSASTYFDNQIFPSFIIGWASYKGTKEKDMGSSLGFYLNNSLTRQVTLKWEIECSDKTYFNVDSGFISVNSYQSFKFMPKIGWDYKALTKTQTATPLNIYFRLVDPLTGARVEKIQTINLRSINDCIRFYDGQDLRFMYAAYVNEDHPEIDNILSDALKTKMVTSFVGYQGDEKDVDLQVAAIWRVLHDRGFKYSNVTDNSGVNDDDPTKFSSQSIRTFDNAIKTNQANCVDGTVVFASILKKIGIMPVIITVPGHCFLGYYRNDSLNTYSFLETTMLSNENFIKDSKKYALEFKTTFDNLLPKNAKLDDKNKAYYLEFLNAKYSATDTYRNNKKNNKKVNTFDVAEYRKQIKPIPVYL